MGPQGFTQSLTCGFEYHEVAGGNVAAPTACECGTFAIGVCTTCGKPVCGNHSSVRDGKRLCVEDNSAADIAGKDEALRVRARVAQSHWDAYLSRFGTALNALSDPTEIFLVIRGAYHPSSTNRGEGALYGFLSPDIYGRYFGADARLGESIRKTSIAQFDELVARVLPERKTRYFDATSQSISSWKLDLSSFPHWLHANTRLHRTAERISTGWQSYSLGWHLRTSQGGADGYSHWSGSTEFLLESAQVCVIERKRNKIIVKPRTTSTTVTMEEIPDVVKALGLPVL
jgi:hypothetical protein